MFTETTSRKTMAKLITTLIALPITSVPSTVRALLQGSTKKKWLFTGSGAAIHATVGNVETLEGNDLSVRSLESGEDFSEVGLTELTVTVDGTEKIKVLSGADNLAAQYKTPETIYFKHLGEIVHGFASGKFPEFAGCTAVLVDQLAGKIYVAPSGLNAVALDGAPIEEAVIEVDAPANDFGE